MRAPALAALALAACGDAASPGSSSAPAITTASISSTGSTGSTGADTSTGAVDDSTSGSGGMSTGTLRDVGAQTDLGSLQPPGCKGKVDILFLISGFGTMHAEQKQLIASFPGFVDTIEEKLAGFDLHIMVANPTGQWPGWRCEAPEYCTKYFPHCGPLAPDYECGLFPELETPCDTVLGAGLVFNAGLEAANEVCELYEGNRYIVSGQPEMDDAFQCIAQLGTGGADPPIGDALIAALSPKLNGVGGCNEGFLRDDALLFLVIINDTEDTESKTYPHHQYDAIIKAKKDPNAVVMLAVIGQKVKAGEPEIPGCSYDDNGKQYARDLLNKFPHRIEGDTCATSYAPYFAEAADTLIEACGNFVPQ